MIFDEVPTTGDFALGRKARLVVAYSGFAVATVALVLGATALTWPGRLSGGAAFLLSFAIAVRAKSGKGFGRLVVDESGVTRRSWFRSKRVAWSEVEGATTGALTLRNLAQDTGASTSSTDAASAFAEALGRASVRAVAQHAGEFAGDDWFLKLHVSGGGTFFVDGADIEEYERARLVLRTALAARNIPLAEAETG